MSNLTLGLTSALDYADKYNKRGRPKWRVPTGEEIRRIRQDVGLSQPQFAEKFGLNLVSLRKWEQGRAEPEQVTVMVLRMIQSDGNSTSALVDRARERNDLADA